MSESRPDIKSASELSEESRVALRDLILVLADSKRILGIRYADWVLGAPELEASIAASSIAQDEWGHSRILYALLSEFGDDPEGLEHSRKPGEYFNIEILDNPLSTWPDFVVANSLVDTALSIQLQSLSDSRYAPLRQRVQKQLEEERFHAAHGAAWLRRLSEASTAAHTATQEIVRNTWATLLHWFGPDELGARQKEEGLWSATGEELRDAFVDRVTPLLDETGFVVPATHLDFAAWDPHTRRKDRGGPEADAVARARGDRNRALLME